MVKTRAVVLFTHLHPTPIPSTHPNTHTYHCIPNTHTQHPYLTPTPYRTPIPNTHAQHPYRTQHPYPTPSPNTYTKYWCVNYYLVKCLQYTGVPSGFASANITLTLCKMFTKNP